MTKSLGFSHRTRGFTLIEMVMVIVITGILSGIVAVFIAAPVEGYIATALRGDLVDNADLALRRLSRELSLALPNSVRVTTQASGGVNYIYIEFIPTSGGGGYLSESDATAATNPLNYSDVRTCTVRAANCMFDVVGPMPTAPAIAAGDFIVVYNQGRDADGNSYEPADAYLCGAATVPANCNLARVAAPPPAVAANSTVTLLPGAGDLNVFAMQTPPLPSPSNRFHVVPGGVQAITYACPTAPGSFYRHAGYGIHAAPATAIAALTAGNRATIADNASCVVEYNSAASQRNGVLSVTLTLRDATNTTNTESVTLMREIHLDNSP